MFTNVAWQLKTMCSTLGGQPKQDIVIQYFTAKQSWAKPVMFLNGMTRHTFKFSLVHLIKNVTLILSKNLKSFS